MLMYYLDAVQYLRDWGLKPEEGAALSMANVFAMDLMGEMKEQAVRVSDL